MREPLVHLRFVVEEYEYSAGEIFPGTSVSPGAGGYTQRLPQLSRWVSVT